MAIIVEVRSTSVLRNLMVEAGISRGYAPVMKKAPQPFVAARVLVMAAAAVILISGLRAAQSLIIPFLLALFLAIIVSPLVGWLKSRRVPTILAVLMVIILLVGTLSGVGALVGGSVNEFIAAIPTYQVKLNQFMASSDAWLERFDVDLPSVEIMDYVNPGALMNALGAGLRGLAATLSNTFLILLTMAFILLEASTIPVKMQAAFGDRPDLSENLSQITKQVQRYLAMKTLISLVTAVCVTAWTSILGLDFAFVWGLLAFLLNYIPSIGSIIAAIPAVLFTLVQHGVGPAILAAIGYVVINVVLGNIVEPNVMGRTLGLSTLVVFLSLVFWGWVWGPMGMLLSVPLTMIVKIFLENSDDLRWMAVLLDSGRAAQARLEGQVPTDGNN